MNDLVKTYFLCRCFSQDENVRIYADCFRWTESNLIVCTRPVYTSFFFLLFKRMLEGSIALCVCVRVFGFGFFVCLLALCCSSVIVYHALTTRCTPHVRYCINKPAQKITRCSKNKKINKSSYVCMSGYFYSLG